MVSWLVAAGAAGRWLLVGWLAGFSRMRSEGFSFNSWGSGGRALFAIRCFYVRNRSQPSATVRGRALRRCHWGKLLQGTIHGCVTCQFAPLFHCDLHEKDMSRKQRDAFRCTGAAFGEICRLLRSSIGISVWRVVFLGCWMWPCHWDLPILVDGSVLRTGRNHSKRVVWCKFC